MRTPGLFGCVTISTYDWPCHGKMSKQIFPEVPTSSGDSALLRQANLLYRELSSAAVDVELARIARTWDVDEVEMYVERRRTGLSHSAALSERRERGRARRGKKTFHSIRSGGTLKPGHAARLQALFPRSNISLWFSHPLARVLCDPSLNADWLIGHLRTLPIGRVRSAVWEGAPVQARGVRTLRLIPWKPQLRSSLDRIGTPLSLFALLTRLRLEQLLGNFDGGFEATQIAWRLLPRAIARCRHLLVSMDALIVSLDFFLSWQPYADARLYELLHGLDGSIGRREATLECQRIWRADSSVPRDVKLLRKSYLRPELVPDSSCESTVWDLFCAAASYEEEGVSNSANAACEQWERFSYGNF